MTVIHVFVVYCLVLNPTMCRTLEIAPIDHKTVSVMECIKGGAVYEATTFRLDYAEWRVKGWLCKEEPSEVQVWLKDQALPPDRPR